MLSGLWVFGTAIFFWRYFFCLGYCFFSRTSRFALADDLSGLIFFFGFVFDFRESTSVSFFLRGTDVWTSTYLTLIGGGVGGFLKFKGAINSNATTEKCSKK